MQRGVGWSGAGVIREARMFRFAVHPSDPAQMIRAGWALGMLAAETQAVVTMRMLGMAGAWSVLPSENARMVSEKGPAFADAAQAATRAVMAGAQPLAVAQAWARPLRRRTTANARRLGRRGPRLISAAGVAR